VNEELRTLLKVLTAAGYEVFGMDTDEQIRPEKDGKTRDVIRARTAMPKTPAKLTGV
jgi:hypothetical protein